MERERERERERGREMRNPIWNWLQNINVLLMGERERERERNTIWNWLQNIDVLLRGEFSTPVGLFYQLSWFINGMLVFINRSNNIRSSIIIQILYLLILLISIQENWYSALLFNKISWISLIYYLLFTFKKKNSLKFIYLFGCCFEVVFKSE